MVCFAGHVVFEHVTVVEFVLLSAFGSSQRPYAPTSTQTSCSQYGPDNAVTPQAALPQSDHDLAARRPTPSEWACFRLPKPGFNGRFPTWPVLLVCAFQCSA